jgi:molybdopterin-guanine dinucleotide biosynthesis protein A
LAGKYSKECVYYAANILNEQLCEEIETSKQKNKNISVLKLIEMVGAEIISAEALPFYKEEIFFNMNDIEDYNLFLKKLNSTKY